MSNTTKTISTQRLILRPLRISDAAALHSMFADTETMRFMPSPSHDTLAQTEAHLAHDLSNQLASHWAICMAGDDSPIGIVNYLGGTSLPGLGYIIKREFWGRGIVVEACHAVLQYGYEELQLDRVELWIDKTNLASRRVAEKLGFGLQGQLPLKYAHNDTQHMMMVYGQRADAFFGRNRPHQASFQFHNVQPVLMVHDVQKSAEYYRDKLGFRIDFLYGSPPNHAGIIASDWSGSGVTLQLSAVPIERELSVSSYLYIMVGSNIDDLHAKFAANDVDITQAPTTQPWGMREFVIRDLNGHVIIFGTHG